MLSLVDRHHIYILFPQIPFVLILHFVSFFLSSKNLIWHSILNSSWKKCKCLSGKKRSKESTLWIKKIEPRKETPKKSYYGSTWIVRMTSTWIKIVKGIPSLVYLFFLSLTLKYHHLHFPCAMTWEVSCVRLKIKSRKRSYTTASSFKISNEHQSLRFWKKGLSYLLQMLKTKERSFHLQRYSVQSDSCTLFYFRFNQPCLLWFLQDSLLWLYNREECTRGL